LDVDLWRGAPDLLRQMQAYVAGSDDNEFFRFALPMAERFHDVLDFFGSCDDVDLVAGFDPIMVVGDETPSFTDERHDGNPFEWIASRGVDYSLAHNRAMRRFGIYAEQRHEPTRHRHHVECAGRSQPPGNPFGDLYFRGNNDVDRQM